MKKNPLFFCLINKNDHYMIPIGNMSIGADNSLYFFFPGKEEGAHLSFHPGEFHYKDNKDTIVIPKEEVFRTEETIESLRELSYMPYHIKPFIKELILVVFPFISFSGCVKKNCSNRYGWSMNYNILRYDLIDFFNKGVNRTVKFLGKPSEGFQYDDEKKDEEYDEHFIIIDDKFDLSSLKVERCDFCSKISPIFFKKGKFHYFDCPECSGTGIVLSSIEKYRFDL